MDQQPGKKMLGGKVLFVNNIPHPTFANDVAILQKLFDSWNYDVVTLPQVESYEDLVSHCNHLLERKKYSNLIVLFFGYGYHDYVFVDRYANKTISYLQMCRLFSPQKRGYESTILLTEVHLKHKGHQEIIWQYLPQPRKLNHVGLKINKKGLDTTSTLKAGITSSKLLEKDFFDYDRLYSSLTHMLQGNYTCNVMQTSFQ